MLMMYDVFMQTLTRAPIKVADEVFLVLASLHRRFQEREDFSVNEILEEARRLNLTGTLRTGFVTHVRQHSVANLPPAPGRYRTLFAVGKRRRLLLASDKTHPDRDGKRWPNPDEIPPEYGEWVTWAQQRFHSVRNLASGLAGLIALRGTGSSIWGNEPADQYVNRLRENWA
jgi:hypothetical protein